MAATDFLLDLKRHRIDRTLRVHWDPIGAQQIPDLPQDEYACYAPSVLELVESGRNDADIAAWLVGTEFDRMGLGARGPESRLEAVAAIRAALAEPTLPASADVGAFIEEAILRGQSTGLEPLSVLERRLFLISELEVSCDMGNINSVLNNHPSALLLEAAESFAWLGAEHIALSLRRIYRRLPERNERELGAASALVSARHGYGYDDIAQAVFRWAVPG